MPSGARRRPSPKPLEQLQRCHFAAIGLRLSASNNPLNTRAKKPGWIPFQP